MLLKSSKYLLMLLLVLVSCNSVEKNNKPNKPQANQDVSGQELSKIMESPLPPNILTGRAASKENSTNLLELLKGKEFLQISQLQYKEITGNNLDKNKFKFYLVKCPDYRNYCPLFKYNATSNSIEIKTCIDKNLPKGNWPYILIVPKKYLIKKVIFIEGNAV